MLVNALDLVREAISPAVEIRKVSDQNISVSDETGMEKGI